MKMTKDGLLIRAGTIDDGEAIASMLAEFREYLHGLGDLCAIANFGIEEYRRDGFGQNPAFQTLIAERGTGTVGYAIFAPEYSTDRGRRNIFLHDLFVRANARGTGVGEALLARVAEICREQGGDAVSWAVWARNESAFRFYEKMGAVQLENVHFMSLEIGK